MECVISTPFFLDKNIKYVKISNNITSKGANNNDKEKTEQKATKEITRHKGI